MSKEPNKDFRQAVLDVVSGSCDPCRIDEVCPGCTKDTDRILALCKEMLVPKLATSGVDKNFNVFPQGEEDEGWNACRQHLLKQLGEK